jgi:hypothetical protein
MVRATWLRRSAAILCGIVFAFGVSAGPLHYALVEHQRCAEHGELVHGSDDAHGIAVASLDEVDTVSARESHGEHGHCDVLASTPDDDGVRVGAATVNADVAPALQSTVAPIAPRLIATSALWRAAPKQSPPA